MKDHKSKAHFINRMTFFFKEKYECKCRVEQWNNLNAFCHLSYCHFFLANGYYMKNCSLNYKCCEVTLVPLS